MAEWTVCAHCGLKHSLRADGLCPRCKEPVGAGPTDGNIYAPPRSVLEPVAAPPVEALPIGRPVFNARMIYRLQPDVLYRLYLLPGEAFFVRVEGQGIWWIRAQESSSSSRSDRGAAERRSPCSPCSPCSPRSPPV